MANTFMISPASYFMAQNRQVCVYINSQSMGPKTISITFVLQLQCCSLGLQETTRAQLKGQLMHHYTARDLSHGMEFTHTHGVSVCTRGLARRHTPTRLSIHLPYTQRHGSINPAQTLDNICITQSLLNGAGREKQAGITKVTFDLLSYGRHRSLCLLSEDQQRRISQRVERSQK